MAATDEVIIFDGKWEHVLANLLRDYLAGRLTNKPTGEESGRRGRASLPRIGKPATAFSAGALSDPDNVVNEWSGLDTGTLAATGNTIECTWCTGTFATTDIVTVTDMDDGGVVVSCFPGGGAA